MSSSLSGANASDQIGAGVRVGHIKQLMTQGDLTRTDNVTDLSVNGGGFFTIKTPFGKSYTRDGSFHFDKNGILVTGDGYEVMGFNTDGDGKIVNQLSPLKVKKGTIPARSTQEVSIDMNLDFRAPVKQFNIEDAENTSNYSSSMTVYDSVGTPRLVTMYYNKLESGNWEYHAVVDGKDAEGGEDGKLVEMASGSLLFNQQGALQEEISNSNNFNFRGSNSKPGN